MTDCPDAAMRDLLPDHLHDAVDARQRAALAAHLAGCADCRAELALLARARQALDRAPAIDLARVAAAVAAARPAGPRIVVDGAPARRSWVRSWVRAHAWQSAAAGVLVAGLGALPFVLGQPGRAAAGRGDTVAVNGGATPSAAADVPRPGRRAAGAPLLASPPEITFGSGLSDLDADALEALILEMEGLEALPHEEPAPLLAVDPLGDTGAD